MFDLKRAVPQDCDYGCGSDAECKHYEAQCETECKGIYQACIAAHKIGKVEEDPCLAGDGMEMCYNSCNKCLTPYGIDISGSDY